MAVSKVTIYRFTKYDITTDAPRQSSRWATREAIVRVNGNVVENTAVEVEASVVVSDVDGMTTRGFNPKGPSGFQKVVLAGY
jgi:hypothetical protein